MAVRIKICGIRRLPDALFAEEQGAWALGFILVPGTRRYLEAAAIRPISRALGPLVVRVGVFQDLPPEQVLTQMQQAGLQVAQLHGNEPPEWAEAIGRHFPVIKAFRLQGPAQPELLDYPASALLVDGHQPGSGQGYPLGWLDSLGSHPRLMLAGGLNPTNLEPALGRRPYALDVSSGVEGADGYKDPARVRLFLQKARQFQ